MKGNRNRDCRALDPFLHNPVTSGLPHRDESVPFKNPANLIA
jgi:hypothetical protein